MGRGETYRIGSRAIAITSGSVRTALAPILVSILMLATGSGQTVYPVMPDTKGNRIELTIANGSTTMVAEGVVVSITRLSSRLIFGSAAQKVPFILPNKESAAVFVFDVARTAPVNKRDTIELRITDRTGLVLTKSIIVHYAGPATFALDQNFPNPFNPSTTIYYQLPTDSRVSLKVFDILGREVANLVSEDCPAGYHDVQWNAANVATGVYFYRMEAKSLSGAQGFQQIRKLMVLK